MKRTQGAAVAAAIAIVLAVACGDDGMPTGPSPIPPVTPPGTPTTPTTPASPSFQPPDGTSYWEGEITVSRWSDQENWRTDPPHIQGTGDWCDTVMMTNGRVTIAEPQIQGTLDATGNLRDITSVGTRVSCSPATSEEIVQEIRFSEDGTSMVYDVINENCTTRPGHAERHEGTLHRVDAVSGSAFYEGHSCANAPRAGS